jgi:hypothetical protein
MHLGNLFSCGRATPRQIVCSELIYFENCPQKGKKRSVTIKMAALSLQVVGNRPK